MIERVRAQGIGVIMITHVMAQAFQVADRIVVLRQGASPATSRPTTTSPDEIVRMMTGDIGRVAGRRVVKKKGDVHEIAISNACGGGRRDRPRGIGGRRRRAGDEGQDLLSRPDPARRVPDGLDRRHHQVHEGRRLRGRLARRPEPQRSAAQPDRRRDQPEAGGGHPRGGRFRRRQDRHREDARRRHPGHDLRPPDHLHAVRPHLGRRHGGDRPYRGHGDHPAADREIRLGEGQGAADPRRSGRPLHARYPEGFRGEDGRAIPT